MNRLVDFPLVLRVSALAYALFFWMSTWLIEALEEEGLVTANLSKYIIKTGVYIAIFLILLSFLKIKLPRRVASRNVTLFITGFLPIFILFGTLSFVYLFTVSNTELFWLLLQIVVFAMLWCVYSVRLRIKLLEKTNYMSKYFEITDAAIFYHPPKTPTLLEPPKVNDKTTLGRLWNTHGPKLAILTFCGYPLQRLFYGAGGDSAVFLLFFILGSPLTIWSVVRVVTGAYLWIYKVYQLEKLHGKPVLFEPEKEN